MKPATLKVNMAKFNELTLRKWSFIRKKIKGLMISLLQRKRCGAGVCAGVCAEARM